MNDTTIIQTIPAEPGTRLLCIGYYPDEPAPVYSYYQRIIAWRHEAIVNNDGDITHSWAHPIVVGGQAHIRESDRFRYGIVFADGRVEEVDGGEVDGTVEQFIQAEAAALTLLATRKAA